MQLSSWDGFTQSSWARFEINPDHIYPIYKHLHVKEVIPATLVCPEAQEGEYWRKIIHFVKMSDMEWAVYEEWRKQVREIDTSHMKALTEWRKRHSIEETLVFQQHRRKDDDPNAKKVHSRSEKVWFDTEGPSSQAEGQEGFWFSSVLYLPSAVPNQQGLDSNASRTR